MHGYAISVNGRAFIVYAASLGAAQKTILVHYYMLSMRRVIGR